MNRFQATSRCECEAVLTAILDDQHHVIEASATHRGARENAPAHSINASLPRFDIGWLCPFCGRNTLRTFYAGALRKAPASSALQPPLPVPGATANATAKP